MREIHSPLKGFVSPLGEAAAGGGGGGGAPTLTSPVWSLDGDNDSTGGVTTDQDTGTLYFVATTSATSPSAAQVKAGQDHTGSAAADSGSQAVSATGAQVLSSPPSDLAAGTEFWLHAMHENAGAEQSNVLSALAAIKTGYMSNGSIQNIGSPGGTGTYDEDTGVATTYRGATSGDQSFVLITGLPTGTDAVAISITQAGGNPSRLSTTSGGGTITTIDDETFTDTVTASGSGALVVRSNNGNSGPDDVTINYIRDA